MFLIFIFNLDCKAVLVETMDHKPLGHVRRRDSSDSTMVYGLLTDNNCNIRNIVAVEASRKRKNDSLNGFKIKLFF